MLTLTPWILVATGGALGALMRYAAVLAAAKLAPGFLFATMLVNILGSFLIGAVDDALCRAAQTVFGRRRAGRVYDFFGV
jgi:fluoride ion exporter CrcB/FEX